MKSNANKLRLVLASMMSENEGTVAKYDGGKRKWLKAACWRMADNVCMK